MTYLILFCTVILTMTDRAQGVEWDVAEGYTATTQAFGFSAPTRLSYDSQRSNGRRRRIYVADNGPVKSKMFNIIGGRIWGNGQYATGLVIEDNECIYMSLMNTEKEGGLLASSVIKVEHGRTVPPANIVSVENDFLVKSTCRDCHKIYGRGGDVGPSLGIIKASVMKRIDGKHYLNSLDHLKNFYNTEQRQEIQKNLDKIKNKEKFTAIERAMLWVETKLKFPAFEQGFTGMPELAMTDLDRRKLASTLVFVDSRPPPPLGRRIRAWAQEQYRLCIALAFLLGLFSSILGMRLFQQRALG